jgi:hypothetical protein
MSKEQSADAVEAEAARVRSQLAITGADIRRRASPAALMESAQTSLKRSLGSVSGKLSEQFYPVALVSIGGALGVIATSLFSNRKGKVTPLSSAPAANAATAPLPARSPLRARGPVPARRSFHRQTKAGMLSIIGIGAGYLAGLLLPDSPTEQRLFARPKAVLRDRIDTLLQDHFKGMKLAAFNLFGASRLSAAALIGLSLLAQILSEPPSKPQG